MRHSGRHGQTPGMTTRPLLATLLALSFWLGTATAATTPPMAEVRLNTARNNRLELRL